MRLNLNKSTDEARLEAELTKLKAADSRANTAPRRGIIPNRERESRPELTDGDRAEHQANRNLPTVELLAKLQADCPEAYAAASMVGNWVWLQFKQKPTAEIRRKLYLLGFHWNRKRSAWQHPCGVYRAHSKSDPRFQYGVTPVGEPGRNPQIASDEEALLRHHDSLGEIRQTAEVINARADTLRHIRAIHEPKHA